MPPLKTIKQRQFIFFAQRFVGKLSYITVIVGVYENGVCIGVFILQNHVKTTGLIALKFGTQIAEKLVPAQACYYREFQAVLQ